MKTKKHGITPQEFPLEEGKVFSSTLTQSVPLPEKLDIIELRKEQKYTGTKLDSIIGKWPGDELIEELLTLLNK
ncbi:MAG: hypothetical protein K9N46_05495 [Candidatus Marinimicrobia bacterium]|nr:hypothetical protein [Candidatus Neomarinimicrobiota bacterium]MCF7880177.1 hypothetical protein [Candidatus Neomarinimicrobiota bacterium]